jgi:hypothetical protein
MNRKLLIAAIFGITVIGALFDLWTSEEIIGSILFTLPLTLCAMQRSKPLLWSTATVTVLLVIVAGFWGFNRSQPLNPLADSVNRRLLIVSLLTLSTLIHFGINQSQKIVLDAAEIEHQRRNLSTQK